MANAIDPRLYAGELQDEFQPSYPSAGAGQLPTDTAIPVGKVTAGMGMDVQAAAARTQAERERASTLESVGATLRDGVIGRVYDRVTKPEYPALKGYNVLDSVNQLSWQPTEDELTYFEGTLSPEEFVWKENYIMERRQREQAKMDSPWASGLTELVQPEWFLLTPAGAAVGRAFKGATAARAAAGVSQGLGAAGLTAVGEGPVSEAEVIIQGLANGALGTFAYRPGKGLVRTDPDFPADELRATLRPSTAAGNVVQEVDDALSTRATGLGEKLQWNMRKTMSSFGPAGKKIADTLFDNNSDLSINSMESHRWAIRQELTSVQRQYEDMLRQAVADDGYGTVRSLFQPGKASRAQASIERDVQLEMLRREQLQRQGLPITHGGVHPRIKAMADKLDELHGKALRELKAAGVEGAEDLVEKAGWHHRKWSSEKIQGAIDHLVARGATVERATEQIKQMVAGSLRRANGWDQELARDVGGSIINRALRKGHFEDGIAGGTSRGEMALWRDLLENEGLPADRVQRALDVITGQTYEASKASFLKHRVDFDHKFGMTAPDGSLIQVVDLLDNRLTDTVNQYLDGVSTQAALARKGLRKQSDIDALRKELMETTPANQRKEAAELFDNVMNHFNGRPTGEATNKAMRMVGMYGRMIALKNSGLWQVTEYANMMAEYGLGKAMKYAVRELPVLNKLMQGVRTDPKLGRDMLDVLEGHSANNVRIRPFLHRFEDNFQIGTEETAMLGMMKGSEIVPYVNMMKFIHGHQAKMASNLIVDRLRKAAEGNVKAQQALEKYGIGSRVVDKLKSSFNKHGTAIDKWDDGVWDAVRPAFGKMMDEAVLHGRLGDVPAFAAFDKVGKFLFTYRSFMLNAHNKVLAGGIERNGIAPTTLMLLYQAPLAAMAVSAQNALQGNKELTEKEMWAKALGQMGGLGFGAELAGVLSGSRREFGAPGLIPIDRAYQLLGATAGGNWGQAGATAAASLPILSLLPPVNGVKNLMKEQ